MRKGLLTIVAFLFAVSIAEAAKTVASQNNEVEVLIAKIPDPHKSPERYVPSVIRAAKELDLINEISFDEAVQNFFID